MANVELKTYGDVKAIINKVTKQNIFQNVKGVLADEGVNIAVSLLASVVQGIGAAKKTYDIFRAIGKKPDTQKTNTWLDKLDIDDQTAAIVDDTVENGFFQQLANTISKIPDDTALDPSFDINKRFEEYLKQKYKNHYVAPVQEIKTMKKSQLRQVIREELNKIGYSKYKAGGTTTGSDTDFSEILWNLVHGKDQETRGNDVLDRANPENVDRITRGEEPMYEEVKDLYSKDDAIQYIEDNLGAKYYKIASGRGTQQVCKDENQAIQAVQDSPINEFELDLYGETISFSAPYDEAHGAAVRAMGGLD